MPLRLGILVAAMVVILSGQEADATAAPEQARPAIELDEIIVQGNHLWQIREAILDTENRFYARYNELNTNDDFDVICGSSAPLGTRIASRRCRIAFEIDASYQEANAILTGGYAPSAQLVWLERVDEYRKHALQVINGDRQLRKLIRQREVLARQLDARRKEIFKTRWIDW